MIMYIALFITNRSVDSAGIESGQTKMGCVQHVERCVLSIYFISHSSLYLNMYIISNNFHLVGNMNMYS